MGVQGFPTVSGQLPQTLESKISPLQRYFLKFEKFSPSAAFPKVDAALRGARGPVQGTLESLESADGIYLIFADGTLSS